MRATLTEFDARGKISLEVQSFPQVNTATIDACNSYAWTAGFLLPWEVPE